MGRTFCRIQDQEFIDEHSRLVSGLLYILVDGGELGRTELAQGSIIIYPHDQNIIRDVHILAAGLRDGFDELIGQIVIATQDGYRLGQGFQPLGEPGGVVPPDIGDSVFFPDTETGLRQTCPDLVPKSQHTLLAPDHAPNSVKGKVTDPFFDKIVGRHLSGKNIVSTDIDQTWKGLFKILGNGQDTVFHKKMYRVTGPELSDDGIGFPGEGKTEDFLQAVVVP